MIEGKILLSLKHTWVLSAGTVGASIALGDTVR